MTKAFFAIAALLTIGLLTFARGVDKPTVGGKWHFVFDTQGGDRDFNAVFEQSGDNVSGKWNIGDTNPGTDVKGTFVDGQLLLDFPTVSDEAGPGNMKLKGKLGEDGSLVGDWAFLDYNGTFKATHPKGDAPK